MKVTYVLIPALAAFLAASLPAVAADEATPEAKTEKPVAKKKAVKPHSHLEEKTGMSAKPADEAKPEAKNAAKNKKLHYHPRDAK